MNPKTLIACILYIGILFRPASPVLAEETLIEPVPEEAAVSIPEQEIDTLSPRAFRVTSLEEPNRPDPWIQADTIWTAEEGPYVLHGPIRIYPGVTLTIEPGAVMKGDGVLNVFGTLIAGSEEGGPPVIFSSWHDDTAGGDMNNADEERYVATFRRECSKPVHSPSCLQRLAQLDENGRIELAPAPGEGAMIIAREGGTVSLNNVDMRFGGGNGSSIYSSDFTGEFPPISGQETYMRSAQVANTGGFIRIASSTFSGARHNHLMQTSGETIVERSRFAGGLNTARIFGGSLTIANSSLTGASGYGILDEGFSVSAENNWWGDASGPKNSQLNPHGTGSAVSGNVAISPWFRSDPFGTDEICTEDCASNVLFLPGIKGSRLYAGDGSKLWEPFGDHDVEALMLKPDGTSVRSDIYTASDGIVDSVALFMDIYGSFAEFMDGLEEEGTINEWRSAAYDWRLSLPDIVAGGNEENGRLSYIGTADEPHIRKTLEELAATSKSGKVTIVAHSNGGLVAKQLMQVLGDAETTRLIDDVIFVGVPQTGAPQALGSLLYGYEEGIPAWFPGVVSTHTARTFAENSPMGYHLLPSERYFETMRDSEHPVVRFGTGKAYEIERAAYGDSISNFEELVSFALAREGGREEPTATRIDRANVLNENLLSYGREVHDSLDAWTPPEEVQVHQIAGWGADTVAGIDYYEKCVLIICASLYRPSFVEDGDGVVPVPSALMMRESDTVKRYWLDLRGHGKGHGDILAIPELRSFIRNILLKDEESLPESIRLTQPLSTSDGKKLYFYLHSPLTLELRDTQGNRVGMGEDGTVRENIPGARYGSFGDVQYIIAPAGNEYELSMHGYDSGTFTLEVGEVEAGLLTSEIAFVEVPVTEQTLATLRVLPSLESEHVLESDIDGNGALDMELRASAGEVSTYKLTAPVGTIRRSSQPGQAKNPDEPQEESIDHLRRRLYLLLLELLLDHLRIQYISLKPNLL